MSPDASDWPRAVYSTRQVREFDRLAIEDFGIAGFDLMQRAGSDALAFARTAWPDARTLLIYCGAGNNAGDGYVLAAEAVRAGLDVRTIAVVDPAALRNDAARALALARDAGVDVTAFADSSDPGADADLIVDALLGTGLTREVTGDIGRAVRTINASSSPVLALDVPTGLDSDDGSIHGVAVAADATITFVGLKAGLFLGSAPAVRGRLAFSDLGVPSAVYADQAPMLRRLDQRDSSQYLSRRSGITHKGMNGRVLIIGGSSGMSGAARLAAEAALRAGAGLVHAAVAPESVPAVMAGRPEIMCHGVDDADQLSRLAEAMNVVVVGPGLGRDERGRSMARAALALEKPLVVDADALNYLSGCPRQRADWILTPHAGEAATLLGSTAGEVQTARDESVRALAERYGGVAVLKGPCSLVTEADEGADISVCDFGNPGMATGGTGDVLAGLIGGLVAQFGFSRQAAEVGVLVHALAGDDAAADGERGMLASDLLAHIRRRVNPA